jgi:hypothetical protein
MIARVGIPQAYVNQTSRRITAQKFKIYNWISRTISSSKNGSTGHRATCFYSFTWRAFKQRNLIMVPFVLKSRGSTWKPGTNMQIILIWSARWIPLYILLMTFYFEFGFVFGLYIISLKQLTIYIMSTKHGHFCVMCNMCSTATSDMFWQFEVLSTNIHQWSGQLILKILFTTFSYC